MQLYSGTSIQFIEDTVQNQIAVKLKNEFFRHFRYNPPEAEINSWKNSLRAVCQVFQKAELNDHGVILEYQLPLTSRRLDCLVCGKDGSSYDNAVIVELKQWDKCSDTEGENLVNTWLGGALRDILHPSAQVGQYHQYLSDMHTAFYEGSDPIKLSSCAYLHNYHPETNDTLFINKFSDVLEKYPSFTADHVDTLCDYLGERLTNGEGVEVLKRVEESKYRPSKKLMEHVANVIDGVPEYILLDEQLVVYEKVLSLARKGFHDRRKTILIIQGGPGTGKSVIAINLMADLLREGYNAHYATGSRAFTTTLRKIIGRRGEVQFKYFNSYVTAKSNEIDVLICDEAHRIRETSDNRFTRRDQRSTKSQIQELIDVAKVSVFFVDDNQRVRANEIGSSEYLRQHAEINNCFVHEHKLEAQFRCAGSEAFVSWIDNTLGIERTANVIWETDEEFDFRVYRSPVELDEAIKQKAEDGFSARMSAGFCWKWSKPNSDGTLVEDVVIGDYRRPWNAKSGAGRLAPGIPKESLWAHDPQGINQVGCIYTAQGFEFDYVGVIFGHDLVYDFNLQSWVGHPDKSHDRPVKRSREDFANLVKNTYRVLFSRGLKGCYVYFADKETENFFLSRTEGGRVVEPYVAREERSSKAADRSETE